MSVDKVTVLRNSQDTINKIMIFEKIGNKWLICSADLYNRKFNLFI